MRSYSLRPSQPYSYKNQQKISHSISQLCRNKDNRLRQPLQDISVKLNKCN